MKKLSSITLLGIGLLLCVIGTSAQETTISASKKALIRELNEVTGAKQGMDQMLDTMLSMQEAESAKTLESVINGNKSYSPEEKKAQLEKAKASSDRMNKKFRDFFSTELNLSAAMDEISYTIFDKYFSDDELKDLITFYKSSTGKKAISVMPKLFADSMSLFSERYAPKITEFVKRVTDEEIVQLTRDLDSPSAKPQK